jgi:transcriptional regulator with XRE-family HTH domain
MILSESSKRRSDLALFLKFLRRRIDGDVRDLGPHARLPSRLGKRVTQEELAELIGVSREWYGMLESAATTRPSAALVERLADALGVTPEERARLFQLAVPELGRVQLREDSIAVLEGFSRLRSLTKRLWAATSTEDVLTAASEDVANWFDDATLIEAARRRESGLWESRVVDDQQARSTALKVIRELEDEVLTTSEAIDALNLYPQLANAGDTGSPELHPLPVQREVVKLYARRRLAGFTFIKGRLRTRTGWVGGFCIVHELGHSYSAADRAVLGAFAELTSLALS